MINSAVISDGFAIYTACGYRVQYLPDTVCYKKVIWLQSFSHHM